MENPALVHLGGHLFWDPRLSASGKTACVTCHLPHLGWAVTDARSRNDSGKLTSRKSQTLIGIGYIERSPFGWDGRNPTLEAQAKSSIGTGSMSMRETGTPVAVEVIERRVQGIPEYVAMFKAALPGSPITVDTIARAVAAFERPLEPGPWPEERTRRRLHGRSPTIRHVAVSSPRPIKKRFPVAHDGVKNVGMTGAPLPVLAGKERLDAIER